eukprot:Pgem_evm2s14976
MLGRYFVNSIMFKEANPTIQAAINTDLQRKGDPQGKNEASKGRNDGGRPGGNGNNPKNGNQTPRTGDGPTNPAQSRPQDPAASGDPQAHRDLSQVKCYACGNLGHYKGSKECPKKEQGSNLGSIGISSDVGQWTKGMVSNGDLSLFGRLLVDTGSLAHSLITEDIVKTIKGNIMNKDCSLNSCGSDIPTIGTCRLLLTVNDVSHVVNFVVTQKLVGDADILLGGAELVLFKFKLTNLGAMAESFSQDNDTCMPCLDADFVDNEVMPGGNILDSLMSIANDQNDFVSTKEVEELAAMIENLRYDPTTKRVMKGRPFKVELKDETLIHWRTYPIKDPFKKQGFKEECKENLASGIVIKPDPENPYCCPITCADKPEKKNVSLDEYRANPGKYNRYCLDTKDVNSNTVIKRYPLPTEEELNLNCRGYKYYCVLDNAKGFYQIPIHPDSQKYFAFYSAFGKLQPTVLPFGPTNGPFFYQERMNVVTEDLINTDPFFDDAITYANTKRELYDQLRALIVRYTEWNVQLRIPKCLFAVEEAKYLGRAVDLGGSFMSNDRVQAYLTLPSPNSTKEVKSLLQSLNYWHRYIPNLSVLTEPISRLIKGKVKFKWDKEQEDAWLAVQEALKDQTKLVKVDPSCRIILQTDASQLAMAGVALMDSKDGLLPIAFVSTKFDSAQKNYSITDREALAIVWSCKKLYNILIRHPLPFVVQTDHAALLGIFKNPTSGDTIRDRRIFRYQLAMKDFNWSLEFIPGLNNVLADYFSRHTTNVDPMSFCNDSVPTLAALAHDKDCDWCEDCINKFDTTIGAVAASADEITEELIEKATELHLNLIHAKKKKLRYAIINSGLASDGPLADALQTKVVNECSTCARCEQWSNKKFSEIDIETTPPSLLERIQCSH